MSRKTRIPYEAAIASKVTHVLSSAGFTDDVIEGIVDEATFKHNNLYHFCGEIRDNLADHIFKVTDGKITLTDVYKAVGVPEDTDSVKYWLYDMRHYLEQVKVKEGVL